MLKRTPASLVPNIEALTGLSHLPICLTSSQLFLDSSCVIYIPHNQVTRTVPNRGELWLNVPRAVASPR
eukprot:g64241.t1